MGFPGGIPPAGNRSSTLTPDRLPSVRGSVRRSVGPWAMAAFVCALAVTAIGAGWVAYRHHETARLWQAQTQVAEEHGALLAARNAELEAAFQRSEGDVATLEARVSQTANEKAQVEDEREQMTMVADRFMEISVAYDTVASQFARCIDEQMAWTGMMVDFGLYWSSNSTHLVSQQGAITSEICGGAQASLHGLRDYIDALAG